MKPKRSRAADLVAFQGERGAFSEEALKVLSKHPITLANYRLLVRIHIGTVF